MAATPQAAFYAEQGVAAHSRDGRAHLQRVCDVLPAGNPDLAPGEVITKEIVEYILYAQAKGSSMQGPEDPDFPVFGLNVLEGNHFFS